MTDKDSSLQDHYSQQNQRQQKPSQIELQQQLQQHEYQSHQQNLIENARFNPSQSLKDTNQSGTSNNTYENLNSSEYPRPAPLNPQKFSNNPFIPYDNSDFSTFLPQSIPQPQSPQSRYSATSIRPLSVPVSDAFDYSAYNFLESTPTTSQYPTDVPLLESDSYSKWNAVPVSPLNKQQHQSNDRFTAGPYNHSSHIQTSLFSSPTSFEKQFSSHISSSLSPVSPIENEQKNLKSNSPPFQNPSVNHRKSPQIIASSSIPEVDPNKFKIDTTEQELKLDDQEIALNDMVMKRHRVATQRFPQGRTKPKRSKSMFSKHHHHHNNKGGSEKPSLPSDSYSIIGGSEKEQESSHRVYFNMPLPEEMIDPETDLPINDYPRNKVRTTKYTPLSFLPKNMYFQFSNVANIYFLFVVILGVCKTSWYIFFCFAVTNFFSY